MKKVKRILIVNNNMHIGGVQRALIDLLKEISTDYDITLLLFYAGGELLGEVPDGIRIIQGGPLLRALGMTRADAASSALFPIRTIYALLTRLLGRRWSVGFQLFFQKKISNYDIAISFLHSGNDHVFYGGCNEFVLQCTKAARKIAFLHCDYGAIGADSKQNTRQYHQFDRIAACSEGCRKAFLKTLPQMAEKTLVVHNCQDYEEIRRRADESAVTLSKDKKNIVTVARLGKEKGVLRAIRAIALLGEKKKQLHYFVIGDGVEYEQARRLIEQEGLRDAVTLLGALENPCGYMQAADVLLIPSVSEAAPLVIGEAVCLGTPVLTTKTSSVEEMVSRPGFGWVCENSCEGICAGIQLLLENDAEIQRCSERLSQIHFSNTAAVQEFKKLVE